MRIRHFGSVQCLERFDGSSAHRHTSFVHLFIFATMADGGRPPGYVWRDKSVSLDTNAAPWAGCRRCIGGINGKRTVMYRCALHNPETPGYDGVMGVWPTEGDIAIIDAARRRVREANSRPEPQCPPPTPTVQCITAGAEENWAVDAQRYGTGPKVRGVVLPVPVAPATAAIRSVPVRADVPRWEGSRLQEAVRERAVKDHRNAQRTIQRCVYERRVQEMEDEALHSREYEVKMLYPPSVSLQAAWKLLPLQDPVMVREAGTQTSSGRKWEQEVGITAFPTCVLASPRVQDVGTVCWGFYNEVVFPTWYSVFTVFTVST